MLSLSNRAIGLTSRLPNCSRVYFSTSTTSLSQKKPKLSIDDFHARHKFSVQWGEMDVFAHVNNVTFFRYFETSRMNYFEAIEYFKDKTGPILAEATCKFRHPVFYPDNLVSGSKIIKLTDSGFTLQHCVKSEKTGDIAAVGLAHMVHYDYVNGKRAKMSEDLLQRIAKMEGKSIQELKEL